MAVGIMITAGCWKGTADNFRTGCLWRDAFDFLLFGNGPCAVSAASLAGAVRGDPLDGLRRDGRPR